MLSDRLLDSWGHDKVSFLRHEASCCQPGHVDAANDSVIPPMDHKSVRGYDVFFVSV